MFKQLIENLTTFFSNIFAGMFKIINSFLNIITKKLNTDKNIFISFIITMLCTYFAIDRILEIFLIIFNGVGISYWSPFKYMIVILLPYLAYMLVIESKMSTQKERNISFFKVYCTFFIIFVASAIVQFTNQFLWNVFFSAPNYQKIIIEDYDIIKRAFVALALYIPIKVSYEAFNYYVENISSNLDSQNALINATGYSLDGNKSFDGAYSLDQELGADISSDQEIIIDQDDRFQNILIIGDSLESKNDNIMEAMIIRDIKKKRFLKEVSKDLSFNLLKTNRAKLKMPNRNEFLNKNFSVDMIYPTPSNEAIFESYTKNLKLDDNTYKDIGITYISENIESLEKVKKALDLFKFEYTYFDSEDNETIGINPFANTSAITSAKNVANIIYTISVLNDSSVPLDDDTVKLIESIALILIETYPYTHDGMLPNYEDIYNLLKNLELLDVLIGQFKAKADNVINYSSVVNYFDTEIFKSEDSKAKAKDMVVQPISLLENILENEKLKKLLCNRENNIKIKKHLTDGDIMLFHVAKKDINADLIKMIIFNIYSSSVQDRAKESKDNIPGIIYLPNFGRYITDDILYKVNNFAKYNVGAVISSVSINQIISTADERLLLNTFKNKIILNTASSDDVTRFKKDFGIVDSGIPNNIKLNSNNILMYNVLLNNNNTSTSGYLKFKYADDDLKKKYTIKKYDFENLDPKNNDLTAENEDDEKK